MNKRQKKKLFKKTTGQNPPGWMHYTSRRFHNFIHKPWGGLAELKKQEATRAVHNCKEINRKRQIRTRIFPGMFRRALLGKRM